jgi:hypothetical protein
LAELLALLRVAQGLVEGALGHADADRTDLRPAAIEGLHRDLDADAFLAQQRALRERCAFSNAA